MPRIHINNNYIALAKFSDNNKLINDYAYIYLKAIDSTKIIIVHTADELVKAIPGRTDIYCYDVRLLHTFMSKYVTSTLKTAADTIVTFNCNLRSNRGSIRFRDIKALTGTAFQDCVNQTNTSRFYSSYKNKQTQLITELNKVNEFVKDIVFNIPNLGTTIGNTCVNDFRKCWDNKKYGTIKTNFPNLSMKEHDRLCKAYKGGFNYFKPTRKNKPINVKGYDINSSYLYVLHSSANYVLPKGKGTIMYFSNLKDLLMYQKKTDSFCIIDLDVEVSKVPTINWLDLAVNEKTNLMLTLSELLFMIKHYSITKLAFNNVTIYNRLQSGAFDNYIDKWYSIKQNCSKDNPKRKVAKLMLNNLTGKFGAAPKYDNGKNNFNLAYVPIAIALTSYARLRLLQKMYKYEDKVCYAATDSCYIEDNNNSIHELESDKLGGWKLEFTGKIKIYGQSKYVKLSNNEYLLRASGLPKSVINTINSVMNRKNEFIPNGTIRYVTINNVDRLSVAMNYYSF